MEAKRYEWINEHEIRVLLCTLRSGIKVYGTIDLDNISNEDDAILYQIGFYKEYPQYEPDYAPED